MILRSVVGEDLWIGSRSGLFRHLLQVFGNSCRSAHLFGVGRSFVAVSVVRVRFGHVHIVELPGVNQLKTLRTFSHFQSRAAPVRV